MNKLVLGGVSALAAGVVCTGVYLAVPSSAGASEATAASEQVADQVSGEQVADRQQDGKARRAGRHPRIRRLARRGGVHGEATVRTKKGFVEIAWQRGLVTAKSGGTLTVRSLDGTVWQWQAADKTHVRKNGQKSTVAGLGGNDYVVVAGTAGPGDKRTALAVVVPKKVPARATEAPSPSHN